MIDRLLIDRKLNELSKNIAMLHEFKKIKIEQLRDSLKDQLAIYYGLQISIQNNIEDFEEFRKHIQNYLTLL